MNAQTNQQSNNAQPQNRPTHQVVCGTIIASIWKNQGQFSPMYATRIQHAYRGQDETWQYTSSIPTDRLLEAANALVNSHNWIMEDRSEERRIRRDRAVSQGSNTNYDELAEENARLREQLEMYNSHADRQGRAANNGGGVPASVAAGNGRTNGRGGQYTGEIQL